MICDLCGSSHATEKCPMLLLQDQKPRFKGLDDDDEVHLAYKSLPSWVQVTQGPDGKTSVIVHRQLPRYTRLGPLIAPQRPSLVSNNFFPLKLCHNSGGVTYFDLSRKECCNWLSLIPQGSSANRNLLVCQIDDLLYYVTVKDIRERTELKVWYSPFYHEKIVEELKWLGASKSFRSIGVNSSHEISVNQPGYGIAAVQEFKAAPSLARIAVGKGLITFTHNICGNEENNPVLQTSTASGISDPANSMLDGYIHAAGVSCRYVHKEQVFEKPNDCIKPSGSVSSVGDVTIRPTIEIMNGKANPRAPDKIVTFNITETVKPQSLFCVNGSLTSSHPLVEHSISEELSLGESSDEEKRESNFSSALTRRPYKLKKFKSDVIAADSEVVRQLPPRALGACLPRPWSCRYCGDHFSKPLPFANHVKAHLRWIMWRRFKCEDCGQAFPSSLVLQNHKLASHRNCAVSPSLSSENKGEAEVSVKHEILSEEEFIDDIDGNENRQSPKKMFTLPTNCIKGPHNCQICPKQFHKAEYLLRHLRKHTGDFTCQKCLKVFARKEGLQKHVCPNNFHHESQECSLCNRSFFNTALLQQHYLKHKGSRKCTRCRRFFSNISSLEKHMKNCPSVQISTSFQCGICSKEFVNQSLLDRHMSSHSRQYRCEVCNKMYTNNTSLQQHLLLCRQIQRIVSYGHVKCEECGEVSTNTADFRIHYQKHTYPFNCSGCSHRFKTRVGYEVHVCEVELQCDQCDAMFRSVQALNRHAAVHGPPPFSCVTCRRSYYRKESLDRHVCSFEDEMKETVQPKGNLNFKCNICGVILATRHSYNTHIKAAHGGSAAKEFSCEVCGKLFYRKDLLREHSIVHAPPSHPCPHCKKLFKTRKSLEVHSLLHLGIKRFACKYCNKKYHQKVNLAKHERSHMPRGAVKCQECGYQCLSTDDLKAHLLSHTLVQPEHSQKPQKEQIDLSANKETMQVVVSQSCHGTVEMESVQLRLKSKSPPPCNEAKPHLKVISRTVEEIQTERIFSDASDVLQGEHGLQTSPEGICVEVNSENKDHDFRTDLVHVSGVTKDPYAEQGSMSHSEIVKNSTVFIPEKITNVCLPPSLQSLREKSPYPKEHHKSSSNLESDSISFQSENSAFHSGVCEITDDVHISDASEVTVSSASHTYHLNLDDNCHVTVENRHEHFDRNSHAHFENEGGKKSHVALKCDPPLVGQELVYDSSSGAMVETEAMTRSLKYHVLDNHQINESVVIMTNTHGEDIHQ